LPEPLRHWLAIGRGYLAVDLFFVLSGFVLALTHRDIFVSRPLARAWPDFLLRRVARVMPLNAVIVAVIAGIVWLAPAVAGGNFAAARDPGVVLANLLLIQDWGIAPSIDKPAWSVSVEMLVYLAYPLLIAVAWSRRFWWLPALAGIAGLAWLTQTGARTLSQGLVAGDIIRGFAGFLFGLLAFRAFATGRLPTWVGRLDLAVFAAFWAAVLFSPNDLAAVLLCPALILALALETGPLARLLGAAPLHYLGTISYSIYLVHYCVLGALNLLPPMPPWLYGMVTLALTLAIAAATYHGIERPARRWIAQQTRTGHADIKPA
jgi:peptidoglycan/LPS O-acetylase OafA/YrhL